MCLIIDLIFDIYEVNLWFFLGMINFWGEFIWICSVWVFNNLIVCRVLFIGILVFILLKIVFLGFVLCIMLNVLIILGLCKVVCVDFIVIVILVFLVIIVNFLLICFV